jgi:putative SOS response-associated peptidase YedK
MGLMCGRYVSSASRANLQTIYGFSGPGEDPAASYNVAPTQTVPAVLERREKDDQATVRREVKAVRWGLVPSWAKDLKIGSKLINARVETLASKSAFRAAFTKRRAILLGYL